MHALCDSLVQEHEIIERVLDSLEREARAIVTGKAVDRVFFAGAISFVRKFADGVHHQKEEQVLFPALCDAGLPKDGGPVGVMLFEHDAGRDHIRGIEQSLDAAAAGDANARQRLIQGTLEYVELLRAHIQKENMVLFPMAERVLDPSQQEHVRAGFDSAEAATKDQTAHYREWATSLSR